MFLVGLTGSVGTGKSTVSQIFLSFGVALIDADLIAREVVTPDSPAWQRIRDSAHFGPEYLLENGELDREKVAGRVFSDEASRLELERITHPEIRKRMIQQIMRHALSGRSFVILDVPLLYEKSPLLQFCHKVIVVKCSDQHQVERLRRRTNWSDTEIHRRIFAQMPVEEKAQLADYVVDNDGSVAETQRQVLTMYRTIRASKFHWVVRLVFSTGVLMLVGVVSAVVSLLRWIV